jgi:glycosyltransferase involved in cell wall biosynthesis
MGENLMLKREGFELQNVSKPKVSVIIPCYNYGRYLEECVKSVISQTYQDFEIIIVNDGSTDNSKEVAERLIIAHPHHRIQVIHQPNSGQPAISRNRGIREAKGEYILPLDADDRIAHSMLEECTHILDQNPSIAIAYTDRLDFDGVDQVVRAGDYDYSRLKYENQISYCALFRKEVWETVGGYRTNVKGCEDWDFWVAAGAKGYLGRRIPEPLFMYRRHDTGVYQEVVNRLAEKHAQIVFNHKEVYTQEEIESAEKVLSQKTDPPKKAQPMVSVIVPTCNRPGMLVETLKSVLQQTYPNIEIVVVNDGDMDVQHIVHSINKKGNITYVNHDQNKGVAAARNTGIKLSRGKYIAYLDDDDRFYPQHVETLVRFLESSDYRVAYTDAYRAHQEWKNGEYVVTKRDIPYSFDFDYDWILRTNFVPVPCFMHERSCLDEVGGFDESLKRLEDWDFWIRMSRKFKFAHLKKVTCEFTWRTDGSSMTSGDWLEFITARHQVSRKYGGEIPPSPPQLKFSGGVEKSLVSIVILTFNQLKFTKKCLSSIRKHTPEPHEIIFVDNGSTDGTRSWLRGLIKENPRYQIIENGNNLGFARGCNQGLTAASGEYLLLLNNDVLVTEGWLSGLMTALSSSTRIGIVGPMTNYISGPQQVPKVGYSSIADLDEYARSFREKDLGRRIPFRRIVGFCMLFRRELVERIGLLDENFGTGNFEDDDFSLRAELAGYRNMIAGDVFIHHFGSRSFIGNKIDYRKTMKGNHNYFLEKWNTLDPHSPEGKKYLSLRGREVAKLDYEKGQAKKAVDRLLAVIRLGIESKENYYDLADIFLDAKQYEQAFRVLEQMPDADQDERKYALLGYCQEGLANPLEAQKLAEQTLSLNPSNAFALNLKGILSYRKGDKEEAEDYFQRAAASDPGFGEPHTNLGVIRWEDNRKKEALQLFERGFILSPTITDILQLYHTAVTQTGEFARAEQNFYEARALHPFHQGIRFFLIDILLKQGKYKAAMEEIEQAMGDFGIEDEILKAALEVRKRIGPQEKSSQDQRGRISLCMIAKDEENNLVRCLRSVKPLVDEIIVVDTGSADRTKDIATALGARVFEFSWEDDFSAARNFSISQARGDWILVLDADEVISPVDHASLLRLTKVGSLKAGYSLTTRNYLNTLSVTQWTANNGTYDEEAGNGWIPSEKVRLFPKDRRIHFENPVHEFVEPSLERICIPIKKCNIPVHHYGKLNEKKEKRKGEDYFLLGKKKLEKSSADIQSLRELAVQANILKRHEEAAELWHEVIRLQPNLQEAYVNLTSIYMNLGKFQEASATSQRAIELDPECKEAVLNYSIVEFTLGNLKNVISALENLLSKIPEYPLAMGLLSVAYRLDGGREKSQSLIVKIKKAGFNYDEYLQNTAKDLIALGRTAEAELLAEMMEGKEPRARFQGATLS